MNPKLYIITGIPGSGKSTLARKMIDEGKAVAYYEADMWMVDANGDYSFDPKKLGHCHLKCQQAVLKAMQKRFDVIVSNTTLTITEARPYVTCAKVEDYDIEFIHLTTNFGSIHDVPEWKLKEMENKRVMFVLEDFS